MRVGVWWSAAALALLAVTTALRTSQGEGASHISRRIPSTSERSTADTNAADTRPTFRPRSARRKEDAPQPEAIRTRTRSRPPEKEVSQVTDRPKFQINDRFHSRKLYNRSTSRSKLVEDVTSTSPRTINRQSFIRGRSRTSRRQTQHTTQTEASLTTDESKIEVIDTNLDHITKLPKNARVDDFPTNQFRRRSSTSPSAEIVPHKRQRLHINTRPNARSFDLDSSGTTLFMVEKEPTTLRSSEDLRSSKKLRYKTRLSETNTNLTGEGINLSSKVTGSSQIKENIASQSPIQPAAAPDKADSASKVSTDSNDFKPTLSKSISVLKRPLQRGKVNFRPSVSLPKVKSSDEISEDDNYPESFKALIQANKNVTTQANSPSSESLSVIESQNVLNTYSTSTQPTSTNTTTTSVYTKPSTTKYSRLRKKPDGKDEKKYDESKPNQLRGTYFSRSSRKFSSVSTSTSSPIRTSERALHKFNRKFKVSSTTAIPKSENGVKKRFETNNTLKKPKIVPSYKTNIQQNSTAGTENETKEKNSNDTKLGNKKVLPRTSYYSRLRNNLKKDLSLEEDPKLDSSSSPTENNKDDTGDMPMIFTLLQKSNDGNSNEDKKNKINGDEEQVFIISVTSKESKESSLENIVTSKSEENESKSVVNVISTTNRYHANYKDGNFPNSVINKVEYITSAAPPIRNLQTRKYGRIQQKKQNGETSEINNRKSRDRNMRKFSEIKTTEHSSNGITPEPEKPKSRFSSKYRATYDKLIYKATVPTVTPSTAWLKFFVTDPLLTKSVEEPSWFEEFDDMTTEPMQIQNFTMPAIAYDTSYQLVEGEEIQLGPDMNAISFTQTRSSLSSADLKLAEIPVNSPFVMNVEASQHSPSVTISIFDALAEILTSTPRNHLSSTTEVTQKQSVFNNVRQSLSNENSTRVNKPRDKADQNMSTSANITKFVQPSSQTTLSNVNNQVTVTESATPSLNTKESSEIPVDTPRTPSPTPTTPIFARKPFGIKLLYSETESSNDKFMTISSQIPNQPTTDNPSTVYNTVSDLLLSNNNLVSNELTSMLSNNIKSIIQNMDENSRSRIATDMTKLLRTIIPRAVDRLITMTDDVDFIPITTPYSLEEIRDTENIDLDNNSSVSDFEISNLLQNVSIDGIVNTTESNIDNVTLTTPVISNTFVNSLNVSMTTPSVMTESSNLSNIPNITPSTESISTLQDIILPSTESMTRDTTTSNILVDSVIINGSNQALGILPTNDVSNISVPIPFFTNSKIIDFINPVEDLDDITSTTSPTVSALPLTTFSDSLPQSINDNINTQVASEISPLQLWVLNKKARVLKMIEDIIRLHNNELATTLTLTDMITKPDMLPLSDRLTNIINAMTSTTELLQSMDNNNIDILNFPSTSPIPSPSLQSRGDISTSEEPKNQMSLMDPSVEPMTTQTTSQFGFSVIPVTTETINELNEGSSLTSLMIDRDNTEVTTLSDTGLNEVTLQSTKISMETTTSSSNNSENDNSRTEKPTQMNVSLQNNENLKTPKKDYVIFGILPNNTVVRKNPNDDELETLTESSPYIVYGVLPNNTIIRKFPNGTRVPRVMQKIDILPITPWSLRNPYSPIHNNPAIVRPQFNPVRVSTNNVTSTYNSNNGTENKLYPDSVNNLQTMISSPTLNIKDSSVFGVTTASYKLPAEKSTASHVLSLRTTTMLPSVDEILLNSISSAAKEEMSIASMASSTREPRVLTLDIDPETKQIRTEKPDDGSGNAIFKFIPIDEVTISSQNSNVLKLASTKSTIKMDNNNMMDTSSIPTATQKETTLSPQIQQRFHNMDDAFSTTEKDTVGTSFENNSHVDLLSATSTERPNAITVSTQIESEMSTTTESTTTDPRTPVTTSEDIQSILSTQSLITSTRRLATVETSITTTTLPSTTSMELNRSPKALNILPVKDTATESFTNKNILQINEENRILQALLSGKNTNTKSTPSTRKNNTVTRTQTSTVRSIEDDIRQFEEDTKLLKALLQATGQNPITLNIPTQDSVTTTNSFTFSPYTTTAVSSQLTTLDSSRATTTNVYDDLKKIQEDSKLLEALLQATAKNTDPSNFPVISELTSNVRISNLQTTRPEIDSRMPATFQPINIPQTTTIKPPEFNTSPLTTTSVYTTFQPSTSITSMPEESRISTVLPPINQRRKQPSTTIRTIEPSTVPTARRAPLSRYTTVKPSTSTFSVEEDLAFLKNLKSVLSTNTENEDPEKVLANRVIALAVEKSLNELQTTKDSNRSGKNIASTFNNVIIPTTTITSTTTITTTTTRPNLNTPSIEADIKQFQEDTKLLQALLKATGQDPSKLNIPSLPNAKINQPPGTTNDLNLLSNLLASPSPLNEPFDSLTQKPKERQSATKLAKPRPYGSKIAVKDELNNIQDDAKLLNTLVKLQDAQETTPRGKLTITGQSTDEALQNLLQKSKPTNMLSQATQAPISLSTEFGKSNDALLAALLKEQGFGPTTASSLDEQHRLSALLNQVVVTPKARRTTTPPPPPPPPQAPRRPVLDGLAWLWQQWRETSPGAPRPNRRPSPSANPSLASSASTSNRVNWFGSGPFVGNADDRPSSNRVPLEPPRAVTSEQTPGRGQLVSAAINVTRAFSQFLGAAIQGAAQTVQNVIRAGQRAASDVYTNGSGTSG